MNETKNKSCLLVDKDWTLSMIKDFIKTLMSATMCTDINELKNHMIIECVWRKVEQDMKIDTISLKNFWYYRLHLQLFCTEPIYYNVIKIKLIEYLYVKGIATNKDIKWHNVLSYFDGYTQPFLYRIFTYLLKVTKQTTGITNLADIIDYLYLNQIPNIIQSIDDKMLPRLMYENGNIKHIDINVLECMAMNNNKNEPSSEE